MRRDVIQHNPKNIRACGGSCGTNEARGQEQEAETVDEVILHVGQNHIKTPINRADTRP